MADPVSAGENTSYSKKTGKYMKQGQTAGPYGQDPATVSVNKGPKELDV